MSAVAYGALTRKREEADPGTSSSAGNPGVRPYIDTLAALVPAEVLAAHAFILTFTTETQVDPNGAKATVITQAGTLGKTWWALVLVPAVLYGLGHFASNFDGWDVVRMFIPSAAFVGWTMGQPTSAFDAVSGWSMEARYAIVAVGTLVLAGFAAALGGKADEKRPRPKRSSRS